MTDKLGDHKRRQIMRFQNYTIHDKLASLLCYHTE